MIGQIGANLFGQREGPDRLAWRGRGIAYKEPGPETTAFLGGVVVPRIPKMSELSLAQMS